MLEGELSAIAEARKFQREAGIAEIPVSIEKYLATANAQCRRVGNLRRGSVAQEAQGEGAGV